jgi:hypothetical protein
MIKCRLETAEFETLVIGTTTALECKETMEATKLWRGRGYKHSLEKRSRDFVIFVPSPRSGVCLHLAPTRPLFFLLSRFAQRSLSVQFSQTHANVRETEFGTNYSGLLKIDSKRAEDPTVVRMSQ